MNVRDYFEQVFPDHAYDHEDAERLKSMPLNSMCGGDCRLTIDAASILANRITVAFGNDKPQHFKQLADIVIDVCCCYIYG